jgi:Fe-S cluster assembly protein SufD
MVHVPANTVVTTAIQVLYLTTETDAPLITSPRLLLVAEKSSQVTLLESFIGPEDVAYFTNSVSEFDVEENAVVDHYRLNIEGKEAFHIGTVDAHQERNSNFSTQSVTFGGRINRNDVGQHLDGPGCFGVMNGLYQISGNQVVDNHTRIDHAQPNCETHELYKGILDNKARGIFNGRIMVRQIAQKTDSKQTNRTLLLSSDAVINTNPQLEIFADDVKCTHGATIGQLDANQLYYLKSRGISEEAARRMLVFAFANDVVEKIKLASLRDLLEHHLLIASQEAGKVLAQAK